MSLTVGAEQTLPYHEAMSLQATYQWMRRWEKGRDSGVTCHWRHVAFPRRGQQILLLIASHPIPFPHPFLLPSFHNEQPICCLPSPSCRPCPRDSKNLAFCLASRRATRFPLWSPCGRDSNRQPVARVLWTNVATPRQGRFGYPTSSGQRGRPG